MPRLPEARALIVAFALVPVAAAFAAGANVVYPPPVKAKPGHGVALCPNPAGLTVFASAARGRALREAALYGRRNLATDLANADRAWRPRVRKLWSSPRPVGPITQVLGSQGAARSGFAVFLRPACGALTVNRSLMVTVGPSQSGPGPHCDACNEHLFYVNRGGKPLLWFIY